MDSVDTVLNSNTFILTFDVTDDNLKDSFKTFLRSNDFITQIIRQDNEREWHNLHYFDSVDNCYKILPGNLINEDAELSMSSPSVDKREYLIAMLTGDNAIGNFYSFYSYQKDRVEAEVTVDKLIAYLTKDSNWTLFIVQTNFLKDHLEGYAKENEIRYFDGDYGNDNAILIQSKNKGFLLLTNGTD